MTGRFCDVSKPLCDVAETKSDVSKSFCDAQIEKAISRNGFATSQDCFATSRNGFAMSQNEKMMSQNRFATWFSLRNRLKTGDLGRNRQKITGRAGFPVSRISCKTAKWPIHPPSRPCCSCSGNTCNRNLICCQPHFKQGLTPFRTNLGLIDGIQVELLCICSIHQITLHSN